MSRSVLTLEYVEADVKASLNEAGIDVTSDVVQMALPVSGVAPVSGDWKVATWAPWQTYGKGIATARLLVGPGGTIQMGAGTYDVYVKVSDNPEIPVINVGTITFV